MIDKFQWCYVRVVKMACSSSCGLFLEGSNFDRERWDCARLSGVVSQLFDIRNGCFLHSDLFGD